MNLLLRFVLVMIASVFKPRLGVLDDSLLELRVWPNDIDLNFHLNNGRYLSLSDLGRMDLLCRVGMMRQVIRKRRFPIIGESKIRYRRSLNAFQKFTLRTRLLCWDEKWMYIEHVFELRGGEVAATAYIRGLLRGKEGNVPPREIFSSLGYDGESPPIPDAVLRWIEAERPSGER